MYCGIVWVDDKVSIFISAHKRVQIDRTMPMHGLPVPLTKEMIISTSIEFEANLTVEYYGISIAANNDHISRLISITPFGHVTIDFTREFCKLSCLLLRPFCCFPAKTADNLLSGLYSLNLGERHQSIFYRKAEPSTAHYWFCLYDGVRQLEKIRPNLSKCNPFPALPSATTGDSK